MLERDGQVFLKIMEGRGVEPARAFEGKVLIGGVGVVFFLFGGFRRRGREWRLLLLGKKLLEILRGVSPLQIRNALGKRFLLALLFVDGLRVLFLKEDAHALRIVHS